MFVLKNSENSWNIARTFQVHTLHTKVRKQELHSINYIDEATWTTIWNLWLYHHTNIPKAITSFRNQIIISNQYFILFDHVTNPQNQTLLVCMNLPIFVTLGQNPYSYHTPKFLQIHHIKSDERHQLEKMYFSPSKVALKIPDVYIVRGI